jgi:hypothetical protein
MAQKHGRPFTGRTSKAGRGTRFAPGRQPGRRRLAKAYRAKTPGRFDPEEVSWLAARGCESQSIEEALVLSEILQADPEAQERFRLCVHDGHGAFKEALQRTLQAKAHGGSPRPLLLLAEDLARYAGQTIGDPLEDVRPERIHTLIAERKAARATWEKGA